ncbi:MAG TPA: hypothetical protein VK445_12495 [Dissulfurispiraceae bacterium]|nr:hypothetical protein [Dissulfurispiraceae bacterium]
MMRLFWCSLIFTLIFACPAASVEKPRVIQRSGEVATIDVAAKSMTVKYRSDVIVVRLTDDTLVKMRRERKAFSDIKIGDKVTVWFFEKDKTAKSIEIKPTVEPTKK